MINLFTQSYLEKCVNNPDLQHTWVIKPNQFYYHKVHKEIVNYEINSFYEPQKDVCYYVPRQDELQLLLKEKNPRYIEIGDLKFDFCMRKCVFNTYCNKVLATLSLNDMWLIFFMKELFGKHWSPERKEWLV